MKLYKLAITLLASLMLSSVAAAAELEYRVYNIAYTATDEALLKHQINSPVRILSKSILMLIPASDPTAGATEFQRDATPVARFADMVKHQIRTPVRTLLKGEYRAGADRYTRGTVYQADWSDKGMKLGIKYQF